MSKNALYGIIAVVVIIIIVGAAAAVLLNKPEKEKPSPPAEESIVSGTFTWDTIGDPQTLDPAEAYDTASGVVIQNVYDTLVTYHGTDTKTIYPSLATKWEVDSTGKVWTFHLRKNVTFSNGHPFNAEAVKYSFDRVLIMSSPQTGVSWILSQFMYTYNATTGKWNSPDGESSVRIIDDYTVQFKLREAYGGFLPSIAFTVASIVDPKVVEAHGGVKPNQDNDWMSQNMVGTGPYKLVEWKHNAYIKLEYNPNYWGGWEGKHFKYIMIKNIPEVATREQELLKGDADMAYIPVNHLNDVKGQEGIVVDEGGLTYNVDMIEMNCRPTYQNKTNPLHSKLVRQAISYAIDYDTILENIYMGYAIQLQGPIPKGMPGHDDNLFMYHQDLDKAKQLLKQAGYENGFSVTLIYNQGNDVRAHIAQIVKENLAQIGISVEIQELAWPTLLDKMDRGDYSMIIVGWAPDYNDPDDYAFPFLASYEIGGDTYRTGWHNDTVDKLLMEAKYEVDQDKRAQLYKKVQEIAMEDPSFIYLAQWKHVAVYRAWLKGYYYNPVMQLDFYHLYKEE
ncbi:MAG: ABC transporter substrate-binding protein [Thermoplasmata archaeon]|nr:ABC transporter substrate-binding protein [Thermoplasmata archaeon]